METIHQRIKRLRLAKPATIKELADFVGVTYQSVQDWEREDGTAPTRKRQEKVAEFLCVTVPELLTGAAKPRLELDALGLKAKEEIVLIHFRDLYTHQQQEFIQEVRAMADANRYTRKLMGETPLKEVVSNEAVRAAFGDIPAPTKRSRKKRPPPNLKGSGGDHLGDTDVE